MAIINRVSRLFRSDFNAVLDRIEEPELLLKQAVREMEEDIHSDMQRFQYLENEYLQLDKKTHVLQQDITAIDEELDICFENSEMELARDRVKRKLELQSYEKTTAEKVQSLVAKKAELEKRINENKTRLLAMQQKLELLSHSEKDELHDDLIVNVVKPVSENEIEIALLKEKQARGQS